MAYGELTWRDNDDPVGTGIGVGCCVDISNKLVFLAFEAGGTHSYKYTANGILTHIDNHLRSGLSLGVCVDYTRNLLFVASNVHVGLQPLGGVVSYSYTNDGFLTYKDQDEIGAAKDIDIDIDRMLLFVAKSNTRGIDTYSYDAAGNLTRVDQDNPGGNAIGVNVDTDRRIIFLSTADGGVYTYTYDNIGNLTLVDHDDQGGSTDDAAFDTDRLLMFLSNGSRILESYSYDAAANVTWLLNTDTAAFADSGSGVTLDTYSRVLFLANFEAGIWTFIYDNSGNLTQIDNDDQGGLAVGVCIDNVNHLVFLANYGRGIDTYSYTFRPLITTYNRFILDAGAVYINFVSQDNPGTLLGATREGNVFTIEQEIKDMTIDGAKGFVKGSRRFIRSNIKLTCNFIEHTKDLWQIAIPGSETTASPTHIELSRNLSITDEDYIDNIVIIAQISGTDQAVICGVKNALADGYFEMGSEESNERGLTITFTAHYDRLNLDNEPFILMYPSDLL